MITEKEFFFKLFKRLQELFISLYEKQVKDDDYYFIEGSMSEVVLMMLDFDFCRFTVSTALPDDFQSMEIKESWHNFIDSLWVDYKLEYRDESEWAYCYVSD